MRHRHGGLRVGSSTLPPKPQQWPTPTRGSTSAGRFPPTPPSLVRLRLRQVAPPARASPRAVASAPASPAESRLSLGRSATTVPARSKLSSLATRTPFSSPPGRVRGRWTGSPCGPSPHGAGTPVVASSSARACAKTPGGAAGLARMSAFNCPQRLSATFCLPLLVSGGLFAPTRNVLGNITFLPFIYNDSSLLFIYFYHIVYPSGEVFPARNPRSRPPTLDPPGARSETETEAHCVLRCLALFAPLAETRACASAPRTPISRGQAGSSRALRF